jgi:iron complex transport system substrate-binding protein
MPMRLLLLLALIVAAFVASSAVERWLPLPASGVPPAGCRRIVSMAPSITETLFALGAGDRVVGVSRFCDYPPQAVSLPKVGGFLDPNLEASGSLAPDLAIMMTESEHSAEALRHVGIPSLTVCHQSLDGILESFLTIGRACGAEPQATALRSDILARIEHVQERTAGRGCPRVMVVANRALGIGKLEEVFVAAGDGHLDRLVELAGGQNALSVMVVRFPTLSHEGILKIDPEVIIDLVTEHDLAQLGREQILDDWRQVAQVKAVRQGRVYILADDRAVRPGPGFILLLEHFARLIHPEAYVLGLGS